LSSITAAAIFGLLLAAMAAILIAIGHFQADAQFSFIYGIDAGIAASVLSFWLSLKIDEARLK
jgi:hypothetical protein